MPKPASRGDRWLLAISALIFLITCGLAFRALTSRSQTETPKTNTTQSEASSTIAANLTQIPQAAPLSGQLAADINDVETLIKACADYSEERRSQSQQHIAWLREPSTIPEQMIIALGSNPTEGLLRGLATYALSDWGLKDQKVESCLLPIGKKLNVMIAANGGEPIEAFEEISE